MADSWNQMWTTGRGCTFELDRPLLLYVCIYYTVLLLCSSSPSVELVMNCILCARPSSLTDEVLNITGTGTLRSSCNLEEKVERRALNTHTHTQKERKSEERMKK